MSDVKTPVSHWVQTGNTWRRTASDGVKWSIKQTPRDFILGCGTEPAGRFLTLPAAMAAVKYADESRL